MSTDFGGSYPVTPDALDSFDGGGGRVATNLITNPSFETGTSGWAAVDGTIAQDDGNTTIFSGTASGAFVLKVDSPGGGGGFSAVTPVGAAGMPVTARGHYRVRAFMFARSADTYTVLPGITVAWSDAAGVLFGGGRVAEDDATDVLWLVTADVVAPAGAAYLQIQVNADSVGAAVFALDAVMVTVGAELLPYFDGDSPDVGSYVYDWTGTPHASTSTRTLL